MSRLRQGYGAQACVVLFLLCATAAQAGQTDDPVKWSAKVVTKGIRPGATFDVAITGVADEDWHVYAVTQGPGGPVPMTVAIGGRPSTLLRAGPSTLLRAGQPFSRNGPIRGPEPATVFDPNFDIKTETYEGTFTLAMPVRLSADAPGNAATLRIDVGYQACTNRLCLPPRTITVSVPVKWMSPASARAAIGAEAGTKATEATQPDRSQPPASNPQPLVSFGAATDSWSAFIWLAVSMGARYGPSISSQSANEAAGCSEATESRADDVATAKKRAYSGGGPARSHATAVGDVNLPRRT